MFRASYKVTFANGREWITTVNELDEKSQPAAIREGRRILRKMFPGAKHIRHRHTWRMAS